MVELELVRIAQELIRARFREGRHHVAAALRTEKGEIFSAVHLEAAVGRMAICAEAVALGMAMAGGDAAIDMIVAVDRHGNVIPPCGMCRELISDYSPQARVIVPTDRGLESVTLEFLLPLKGDPRARTIGQI